MVRRGIAVALAVAGAAGCDGDGSSGSTATEKRRAAPAPTEQLLPLSPAAVRRCGALASDRDIPVLCPVLLPRGRWVVTYQTLRRGRSEYLTSLDTQPAGSRDPFHVLAGGRRGRFELGTTGGTWPMDTQMQRDLGLVESKRPEVARRTTVARNPALLLRVAGYRDGGGVHGGHLAVVWNQGHHGYALSMHFARHTKRDQTEQEALLLQAAAAMSRYAPTNAG